jgi:ABC-type polar amino acid transport system ATPase subunit
VSLLTCAGVSLVREAVTLLDNLSFSVERGEVLAVMGPSGAGKSTALRAIAGLEPLSAGTITIDGLSIGPGAVPRAAARRELYRRVGFVFQFHHLFAHRRALENVWLAPVHVLGTPRVDAEPRARQLLDGLGVGHRGGAYPHELSGGEAQRVAIARALAMDPPVLLMDEPTASLDPDRRGELARTLLGLASGGRTLVVATHDVEFARAVATRVVVLDRGRLVRDARAGEVF